MKIYKKKYTVGNSFDQPKENMNFALKNTHGVCQPLQTEQQIKVRTVSAAAQPFKCENDSSNHQ
jgi:hypothetical protein